MLFKVEKIGIQLSKWVFITLEFKTLFLECKTRCFIDDWVVKISKLADCCLIKNGGGCNNETH